MREEKVMLTEEGLAGLKSEVEELKTVSRPKVLERLRSAKELSDAVDSAEYEYAKNEQAFIEGRILTVERMLKHAEVIPVEKHRPAFVRFGSKVKVLFGESDERQYTILGKAETNPLEGKISNESPIGKALLGKHVGDQFEVDIPRGKVTLKVLSIAKK